MLDMPTKETPTATRRPSRPPVHVGEHIREDVLPSLGLTVAETAKAIGVTRQTMYRICNGETGLTADVAVKLAKLAGVEARTLLAWQAYHDIWHAEDRHAAELKAIKTLPRREDV